MTEKSKEIQLKELFEIPGVGRKIAGYFRDIGLRSVKDLKGKEPQKLYESLCRKQKKQIDRSMLYVFRCAVYYASNRNLNPELLQWWKWKDRE